MPVLVRPHALGFMLCLAALSACKTSSSGGGGSDKPDARASGSNGEIDAAIGGNQVDDAGKTSGTAKKPVKLTVPKTGGTVHVVGKSGMTIDFAFPVSAAGKEITLTPTVATEIGWPEDQFAEVIRMEPDGTTFADPIVVRPSTGDVIVLDFPSSAQKSAPEGLPLNDAQDGFLLAHFSTLVVVPPDTSCDSSSGWQVSAPEIARQHCQNPNFPTHIRFGCKAHSYCLQIDADCCAADGSSACHLGDVPLSIHYQAAGTSGGQYAYCAPNGGDHDAGNTQLLCTPNDVMACDCTGQQAGQLGTRSCNSAGSAWSQCGSCVPSDAGVAVDAATPDPDAGSSANNDAGVVAADGGSGSAGSSGGADAGVAVNDGGSAGGAGVGAADAGGGAGSGASDGGAASVDCNSVGTWSLSYVPDAQTLNGVWAYPASDSAVWAVGKSSSTTKALIAFYDGQSWTSQALGAAGDVLNAVWGADPFNVWAVGNGGTIYKYFAQGGWMSFTGPAGNTKDLYAVWGTSASSFWVTGANGAVFYYDGAWHDYSMVSVQNDVIGTIRGIWGRAGTVFSVNDTGSNSPNAYSIHQLANGVWSPSAYTNNASYSQAIWGYTSSEVWAVGQSPAAHYNGSVWSASPAIPPANGYLRGVWGIDPNNVWAVGDFATIEYWNGSAWSTCSPKTNFGFRAIRGGHTRVWAVGQAGVVMMNQ